MRQIRFLASACVACLTMILSGAVIAGESRDMFGFRVEEPEGPDEEKKEWVEAKIDLPSFPEEENLRVLQMNTPDMPYRYLIDVSTLAVYTDGVVRYSLVLEAPSGVRNVLFEGYRCRNKQYKTYAYGTRQGAFRLAKKPDWKRTSIEKSGASRRQLGRRYLCNDLGYPYSRKEIMSRIEGWDQVPIQADESYLLKGYQ